MEYAISLKHISKTFGRIKANQDVSMDIKRGEILAILGENGSGKTTLMNMLAGIYYPDQGEIYVNGRPVQIRSPKDAFNLGIGMIHQHFKLIDVFDAVENIALGLDDNRKFDLRRTEREVREICSRYQFNLDLRQKVYEMNVSQKQTLEIIKVLYRGADILILDEPTAVLTPQETERLFDVIRNMKADNKTVIIITHKLHEVKEISDRVVVLRKGEYITSLETSTATEQELTDTMVGRRVKLDIDRTEPQNPVKLLSIRHLTVFNSEHVRVLDNVTFDAWGGEILGIAGISGNGQKELLESIAGLQPTALGSSIRYRGKDPLGEELIGLTPRRIHDKGIHLSFVPEDRLGMGLVRTMGMVDNMLLRTYRSGRSPKTSMRRPREMARKVKEQLEVITPSYSTPVSRLSGGNVQKVLVGREIEEAPSVLLAAYAVRGLDINTSYKIYNLLDEQKRKGVAVIYVGEDLDVLIDLCDRILVLCGGRVNGILDARHVTKEEIGLRMTKLREEDDRS